MGVAILVISIMIFWVTAAWFAWLPTIIGACMLFANLMSGNKNNEIENYKNKNYTIDSNLKITRNLDGSTSITQNNATNNTDTVFELREQSPQSNYFSSTQNFSKARGDDEKIHELEKSLHSLKSFVEYSLKNDRELPPSVPCRDTLPELYMRRGDWIEAEEVIKLCILIGAYGYTDYSKSKRGIWVSETGNDELSTLRKRGDASVAVLQYLNENPGTLQKDIYKIPDLSSCDHEALVWFCRYSRQIKKEKSGNTNKLFVVEEVALK